MSKPAKKTKPDLRVAIPDYTSLVNGVSELLETARRASARTVNAFMTATYWEVGRRIVEFEQGGEKRAGYGKELLERLSKDLTAQLGRGFARPNLIRFRQFYQAFPTPGIRSTASNDFSALAPICSTASNELPGTSIPKPTSRDSAPFSLSHLAQAFPLSWSHYVLLISNSRSPEAFSFYHSEALRGGWSVRQLARQMDSQFYERAALSRDKAAMLVKGSKPQPGDAVSADEEIRHPLVLEFLRLRDEYSESDLEEALIHHLETFLLELGNDFAFVGRQRRLRIDDEWYRVDLLFFHRRLRCLVLFDLKLGRFSHADAGQMHVYLNYVREHWTQPGENPPVGVILCSGKGEALVRYATDTLPNKMLVREYLTALPDEKILAEELEKTRKHLETRE
jgi:predicted nuclease of restriction endonuclease-like (RecB) superfamily